MKRLIVVLLPFFFTTGFTSCQVKPEAPKDEYPYPVSCVSSEPVAPASSFDLLDVSAPLDAQVFALLSDRKRTEGYVTELETIVRGCK